ncbi:MAG TPA: DNA cytosine methyltransferase [Rhizomicrobium sp.]|jgi:DNA (cytosine-5)-methyltransferase 1
MGRQDYESETLIAHTLRAEGFDASEDGTGRGIPIVPLCIHADAVARSGVSITPSADSSGGFRTRPPGFGILEDGTTYSLTTGAPHVVAFDCKASGQNGFGVGKISPPLRAMGRKDSHQNAGGQVAVAYDLRGRDGGAAFEGPHDTANLRAASGGSSRSYIAEAKVRRLTPRECERLQGFPDDFTLIPTRKRNWSREMDEMRDYFLSAYPDAGDDELVRCAADGPRYKALGNSMATTAVRWIGERIDAQLRRAA